MNIDIRDLVLIGGGLFIVATIVHGVWLAWRSRREPLRMEISNELIPDDDDDLVRFRGELPNGGGRPAGMPVQKDINFEAAGRVPLEPVGAPPADTLATSSGQDTLATSSAQSAVEEADTTGNEPVPIRAEASRAVFPNTGPIIAEDSKRSRSSVRGASASSGKSGTAPADTGGQELLVINVVAASGEEFAGEALLAAIRAQGLRYGEMKIFHRLDPHTGETQFSVANLLEPGYFDLAEIGGFVSPGIVFFLQLPGPANPSDALEAMIRITRSIAEELGAVLKDENMSALTGQTVEHYRERVADYSRRRLSMRR